MRPFASRVHAIGEKAPSGWGLHNEALLARSRGDDVILMSVGDPAFDTPAPIVDAAIAALKAGDTHYTDTEGRESLRSVIAAHHSRLAGQRVLADQVVVAAGAQNALFNAAMCLLEPGDEVVSPDPMYVTYESTIRATGATLVRTPPMAGSFRPDLDALASAITPRTRAILLANPSNPAGIVLTSRELGALAKIALEHDLWVLSDEVYAPLTYDCTHVSISAFAGMAERTVTVASLSKSHAMTGWRLGWGVAPPELAACMRDMTICMTYGLPGFIMEGALAAFESQDCSFEAARQAYLRRRNFVYSRLSSLPGLRCLKPEGGVFMMIDLGDLDSDANAFAWRMFSAIGVSTLCARPFGDCGAGYLRLFFGLPDAQLEDACARIAKFVLAQAGVDSARHPYVSNRVVEVA